MTSSPLPFRRKYLKIVDQSKIVMVTVEGENELACRHLIQNQKELFIYTNYKNRKNSFLYKNQGVFAIY